MFSQLKPVAYNNVDIAPIPFNELLALAQFQRQDQMATEQRIDAYTQFVATNPTFGAATAIAQQKMADLQGVIANTDFKNPTSGANLRRSVSSFMTDRFWVQNKAAYTNYQQSQQAMNHLAQQGMLNEADRLAFEAYANGDPKAKQALHDMYIASGSTPEDARAMAGKSWDGQSDFNYQFVKYNVAELKDAAESAVKAITPVLIKHVDADGIESDRKVIYKDQLDSANSQFRASIDANQTADRAWREYLVKGGSYTKDPKTGRTVLKTPAELQRDKAQFFSGMFEAASPDLQLDQVDVNGRSYATLEEKTNTTSLEKWKLAEHDKRDLLKREWEKEDLVNKTKLEWEYYKEKAKLDEWYNIQRHNRELKGKMNILHAQYTLRAKELEAKYAARGQSGVGSSIFTPGVGEVPAIANTKVAEAAHEAVVNADRVANNALRKGLDVGVPKDVIPKVARDLATILKFGDLNQLDPQYKVQQSPWSGSGMPPQQYRVDRPEWTANPAAIASKIVGLVHANASTEVKKLATSILTEDLSGKIEAIGGWGKFKDLPAAQKEAMITQALSDLNDSTKSGYTSLDSSAFNTAFSNTVTSAGNTTVARAQVAKNFAEIDKSVLSRSPDTFNGGADGAKILSKYVTDESVIGDVNGAGGAKYSVKGHFVQKLGRALNGAEIAHLTTAVNATGRIKNGLIEVLVKPGTGDADSIDGGVFYIEPEGAVGQQVTMYGILNQNRTNFVKGDGYKHVTVPDWGAVEAGEWSVAPSNWFKYSTDVTSYFSDGKDGDQYRVVNVPTKFMVEYATKGERSGVPADVAAETVPMVMVKQRGSKDWVYGNLILDPNQILGMGLNSLKGGKR